VLDLCDSLLFAAPVAWLFWNVAGWSRPCPWKSPPCPFFFSRSPTTAANRH